MFWLVAIALVSLLAVLLFLYWLGEDPNTKTSRDKGILERSKDKLLGCI